ncbi:hypothetical protein [Pseudorhodoferax aquiterrae]|nr:hypothetical protein [Pseudorhodoferax aquiterrae]
MTILTLSAIALFASIARGAMNAGDRLAQISRRRIQDQEASRRA